MILYLDLDGVCAAFDEKVDEMLGHGDPTRDEVRECMRKPGFFRNLDLLPGAESAVNQLLQLIPGHVRVLSAVPHSDPDLAGVATTDKIAWVRQHFPSLAGTALIVGSKANIANPEDLLVDDHPDWNGAAEFGGTVIHFTGPSDWAKVIEEVKRRKSSIVKTSRIFRKK